MKLDCPSCGAAIAAEDMELTRLVAKCSACDSVFSFADEVGGGAPPRGPRPEVGRPRRVRLEPMPDGIEIRRRWFSSVVIFLTFFCVAWDGFLVFWYVTAFTQGGPLIMKIFPIAHLAAGVGITWFTLATWLNTTVIRATYDRLTVRHGPVPWPGKRDLEAASVDQISVERQVKHGKNGSTTSYRLRAHTTDGRTVKLLTTDERDQARFAEQELERFLGIVDRRMDGEVDG